MIKRFQKLKLESLLRLGLRLQLSAIIVVHIFEHVATREWYDIDEVRKSNKKNMFLIA